MEQYVAGLDAAFRQIHDRSMEFIEIVGPEGLFGPSPGTPTYSSGLSCGGYIVRSAAVVEQATGGITTRLWDDPFEWTLPEELATAEKIVEYLNEVEVSRIKAFEFFRSDNELLREIPAPSEMKTLFEILLTALQSAAHLQGQAFASARASVKAPVPQLQKL